MIDTALAPLVLVPLLSGGALAGIAFLLIAVFGVLAVWSLSGHIRRSQAPWSGEVDGGIPLQDGDPVSDETPAEGRAVGEPRQRTRRS